MLCSSAEPKAGDKPHKADICNNKQWGGAVYKEEGLAR
jgi:hypothetical protein